VTTGSMGTLMIRGRATSKHVLIVGEAGEGSGTEDTWNAGVFGEHGAVADARDATLACVVAKEDVAKADCSSWLRGMRR
jgi:hypothetical protein